MSIKMENSLSTKNENKGKIKSVGNISQEEIEEFDEK